MTIVQSILIFVLIVFLYLKLFLKSNQQISILCQLAYQQVSVLLFASVFSKNGRSFCCQKSSAN